MWTYVGTIVALCLGYHMINQMATQVSAAQLTTTSTSPLSPFHHYLFYVSMLHVGVLGMAQYASILGPLPFSPRASHTPPFPVCRTSRLTRQPYPFWFSPPVRACSSAPLTVDAAWRSVWTRGCTCVFVRRLFAVSNSPTRECLC